MPPKSLKCKECQTEYPLEALYACSNCFGPLEVSYESFSGRDPEELKRRIQAGPNTLWRYADFLPVQRPPSGALPTGMTPLIRAERLGKELGIYELWIKSETSNPTHSFKDRVVAVAMARGLELGFDTFACASTGNLANAVAAHAAAAGVPAYVFIPSDLEREKITATAIHGARVIAVNGTYDQVNRLCSEVANERPWAFVNVNLRPYYAEGSKTLAYEVAEQLGWRLPNHVVAPVASGSLHTRIGKAFDEWRECGLVDGPLPSMHGAQAAGCSPVASAFADGEDFCRPVKPDTIARSLAIGDPADGPFALELARRTGGAIESASDDEIREGISLLAKTTGVFTETAGGVTVAVLKKLAERGAFGPGESVVATITGDGLKTPDAISDLVQVDEVEATLEAFEAIESLEVTA
ncbi:MAG: threonine synthase [Solirubrobacterales bacterium]|nr:threonine synthase [Solirubrobacterales bacterium]